MKDLRDQIDRIDSDIVRLIGQRAEIARDIAREKQKNQIPLYQPDREQQVYDKIMRLNPGIVDDDSLKNIYREIMSATLKLEGSISVGYFGAEGSFTHQASLQKFGRSLSLLPYRTINDVFQAVQKKEIRYGVVPIENSTEGMVKATLDALLKHDLRIYADIVLQIKQSLLSFAQSVEEIETIYTHPQAYAQCRNFIQQNLSKAEWIETTSTSEAVRMIAEAHDNRLAAIASLAAGELYQVPNLVSDITDYKRNFTRFIVIGHDIAKRAERNRTMISFNLPDSTGSLYRALEPLYAEQINMRGIESRPDHGQLWSYVFFVDLDGHFEDIPVAHALEKMRALTSTLRILGSYPVEDTHESP